MGELGQAAFPRCPTRQTVGAYLMLQVGWGARCFSAFLFWDPSAGGC